MNIKIIKILKKNLLSPKNVTVHFPLQGADRLRKAIQTSKNSKRAGLPHM